MQRSYFIGATLVLLSLALLASSAKIGKASVSVTDRPLRHQELAEIVNTKKDSTWKAGVNEVFAGKTVSDAKKLLGWKPIPGMKKQVDIKTEVQAVPTQFDSRTKWPKCTTIGTIYNQAECGSCWAFGCVESVQDRFCTYSNQSKVISLSFLDEVACGPCDGCEGGDAYTAWQYVQSTGLVTESCYPYTIPTCPPQDQPCLNFVTTPNCASSCSDSENWSNSKHFTISTYSFNSVSSIQTEIYNNGPVEACFDVYEDFLSYKSGVYKHVSGDYLGGHCVKMIGWGVENGQPYWLINNQWTSTWGDKGQFKIARGTDECGIEDDVVAGAPSL